MENVNSPFNYPKYPNHLDGALEHIKHDLPYAPELQAAVDAANGDPLLLCQAWNIHYTKWQNRSEPYHASIEFPRMMAAYREHGVFILSGRFTYESEVPKGALSHSKYLNQLKPLIRRAMSMGIKFIPHGNNYDYRDAESVVRELGFTTSYLSEFKLPEYHCAQMGISTWRLQGDLDYLAAWLDYFSLNK